MITSTRSRGGLVSPRWALAMVALLAIVLEHTMVTSGQEAAAEDVEPIAVEVLSTYAAFPDDMSLQVRRQLPGQGTDVLDLEDPGHVVTARLVVQPGAAFPWHTHPGPVIVSVTEGDLVYQQASDCIERGYSINQAFVDPGLSVHTAWNPGEEATVLTATFFGVPEGGDLTIPQTDQSDRCG